MGWDKSNSMKNNYSQKIIIGAACILGIILIIVTIDAIYETENWLWFNIAFEKKSAVVSAYGALIGGLLAFLSILFILFQIQEQRNQIEKERQKEIEEIKQDLKDRLILTKTFLDTIIEDIKLQGGNLKEFYEKEKENPTLSNQMFFTVNNNYNRMMEMDFLTNYRAYRAYLKSQDNWEKNFLNLYQRIDFFNQASLEIRNNYHSQIVEKTQLKNELRALIQRFLTNVNDYRNQFIKAGLDTPTLNNSEWFQYISKFLGEYYKYNQRMEQQQEEEGNQDSNLSELKSDFFSPFLNQILDFKNREVQPHIEEGDILNEAAYILRKIEELENMAVNYSSDIKKMYDQYYSTNSEHFKELKQQREILHTAINSI